MDSLCGSNKHRCMPASDHERLRSGCQVDEFQLAEETPEKTRPHAKARTPIAASRETQESQASLARAPASAPASAERQTAEWVTALSPVLEHDESQSPANTSQMLAAEASPSGIGEQACWHKLPLVALISHTYRGERKSYCSAFWG